MDLKADGGKDQPKVKKPSPYILFCTLTLANKNTCLDASCKFLEYQVELVKSLHILQVFTENEDDDTKPRQIFHTLQPDTTNFYKTVKDLCDNASVIHCFEESEFIYGHLRATPLVDDEINAPASFVTEIANPLLEGKGFTLEKGPESKKLVFQPITIEHAEDIIDPDDQKSQNKSIRWVGALLGEDYHETPTKHKNPYFCDQEMIHWRIKTQSVVENARSISGAEMCSFVECIANNYASSWCSTNNDVVKQQGGKEKKEEEKEKEEEKAKNILKTLYALADCMYQKQETIRWPVKKWPGKGQPPVRSLTDIAVEMT